MKRFAQFHYLFHNACSCLRYRRGVLCSRRNRFIGFTTVELLVATVVMAFTLLGVYSVLRQSLFVEETVVSRWRDRAEAARLADYLAETIEQAVRVDGYASLNGGPIDGEPGFELVGIRIGRRSSPSDPSRIALQRYRLVWGLGEESEGLLFLQTIPLAGSIDLGLSAVLQESGGLDEVTRWGLESPTVIGEGLTRLEVQFRSSDSPNADWRDRWEGGDRPPLVRIRVQSAAGSGGYTAERYVVPHVTEALISSTDESSSRGVSVFLAKSGSAFGEGGNR